MLLLLVVYYLPHAVPEFQVEGRLEAIHVLLDKGQLETIKGLVEMNLGEGIEEFEKPSSVIHDPIAEVRARGHISICCIVRVTRCS